jgi:hypothetical protein
MARIMATKEKSVRVTVSLASEINLALERIIFTKRQAGEDYPRDVPKLLRQLALDLIAKEGESLEPRPGRPPVSRRKPAKSA